LKQHLDEYALHSHETHNQEKQDFTSSILNRKRGSKKIWKVCVLQQNDFILVHGDNNLDPFWVGQLLTNSHKSKKLANVHWCKCQSMDLRGSYVKDCITKLYERDEVIMYSGNRNEFFTKQMCLKSQYYNILVTMQ